MKESEKLNKALFIFRQKYPKSTSADLQTFILGWRAHDKFPEPEPDIGMETIKEQIVEAYQKGKVVVSTFEGLQIMKLSDFIDQPADGILYDLNRLEEVVLTFIDTPKWINDYAVAQVIRALKKQVETLKIQ